MRARTRARPHVRVRVYTHTHTHTHTHTPACLPIGQRTQAVLLLSLCSAQSSLAIRDACIYCILASPAPVVPQAQNRCSSARDGCQGRRMLERIDHILAIDVRHLALLLRRHFSRYLRPVDRSLDSHRACLSSTGVLRVCCVYMLLGQSLVCGPAGRSWSSAPWL